LNSFHETVKLVQDEISKATRIPRAFLFGEDKVQASARYILKVVYEYTITDRGFSTRTNFQKDLPGADNVW